MSATTTKAKKKTAEKVVFYSPCQNLRIVRIPNDVEVVGANQRRKVRGIHYQFQQHFLTIREGAKYAPGFAPNEVVMDGNDPDTGEPIAQDAVTWLRAKSAEYAPTHFGHFAEHFPPTPASGPVLSEIVTALAKKDTETLVRILDEEQEGHKRQDVIDAATSALEGLDDGGEEPAE